MKLLACVLAIIFTGCVDNKNSIDICRCLTEPGNSAFIEKNKEACRDAISKALGVKNWEDVNLATKRDLSTKFDSLVMNCQ